MKITLVLQFFLLNIIKFTSNQVPPQYKFQKNTPPNVKDCKPDCSNRPKPECNEFEIELRAAIIKCSRVISPFASATTQRSKYINAMEESKIDTFALKCAKKLSANLKITNKGETSTINQYIIIDHVTDSNSGQRVSLLNPYVIVLRQKPLLQLYGLKYRNIVNAEPKEHVINKKSPDFMGCDDVSDNPTCGAIRYNGDIIPFSQGFCCSCDEKKNVRRQPRTSEMQRNKHNISMNIQDFIYQHISSDDNLVFNTDSDKETFLKRDKKSAGFDFNDYRSRFQPKLMDGPVIFVKPKLIKKPFPVSYPNEIFYKASNPFEYINPNLKPFSNHFKNMNSEHIIQTRGGENCNDTSNNDDDDEGSTNPTSYDDSAHCLKFSELWYIVYQLSDPILEHSIYLRLFEKRDRDDGSTSWIDLTSGKTINIGSLSTKYMDKQQTVLITYENGAQNGEPVPFSLDPKKKRILVPQTIPKIVNSESYPEVDGGPAEYLVVDSSKIETNGEKCDTIGVGYTGFYGQPHRCDVPQGTCLKNQPSQLWRVDKQNCERKKRGKYFLKNFARVPENALRDTKKGDSKYLALHYSEKFKSAINIEVKADDNMLFQSKPMAKIIEVYIDATNEAVTILIIKIHNSGLISNCFHPRLNDCPLELPVDWGNLESEPVVIPPQHHSTFTLRLLGSLPVSKFYCTVEALNSRNEIVAVRRIRVIKGDRCVCSWHCLCACVKKTGLSCVLMSSEHYKAAGFIGSMPLTTNMVQVNYYETVLFGFCYFTTLFIFILLIMGLTKGVIGICFSVPVGIWGLDMLIGVRSVNNYYERSLRNRPVIYDCDGWPIHPDTYQRNVRIVDNRVEFCLNLIFFFTYPIMLLFMLIMKICCPFYAYTGDEDRDTFFEGVSAVVYTKCPDSKHDSESDPDQFEFEDISTDRSGAKSQRSRSQRSRSNRN